ncbi:hypothetical protein CC85DRAFT_96622 [Cutaneotrichosporon oleaginosum]|uniref:Uncharacterized protein n=1 Tax=Cutaneotrichosporon oleaginosum TaxID=879819 RepID=A0A0J0XM08_9TREE|nr:uncharacterized protein CC85DRAFT_96622 [Cutaneotrichosporon oleaginosum]KLT42142.1 hypothetical protein CC85DRAFT_96622 [Cutaneotrichosporon oleaginosum]TXT11733.1 hypothetical protein COLE_02143 [Cutaneotrichosporon oleaginosum]
MALGTCPPLVLVLDRPGTCLLGLVAPPASRGKVTAGASCSALHAGSAPRVLGRAGVGMSLIVPGGLRLRCKKLEWPACNPHTTCHQKGVVQESLMSQPDALLL